MATKTTPKKTVKKTAKTATKKIATKKSKPSAKVTKAKPTVKKKVAKAPVKKATRTLKTHPKEKKSVIKKIEKVISGGLKVGGKIDMAFHGAGVTSHEKHTISNFDSNFIWIESENSAGEFFKFDRKTGKCVNDNTFGGFSRTIIPQ